MKRTVIFILILLIIASCNRKQEYRKPFNLLPDCNQVDIIFTNYFPNSTTFTLTDTPRIRAFSKLLNGDNMELLDSCKSNGQLVFKKDNDILLKVNFSIPLLNNYNQSCSYLNYTVNSKHYISKLSNEAERIISIAIWSKYHPMYYEQNHE